MQCARQRRRFQCGNLVFGRQLADLGRDQAGALGQHARRAALRFVVPQRHGIVRGVGHHHVRLGHVGHHAAARGLALLLADARLDVRVALAFLVFLAHVFLGHAQLLQVAPDLPGHVQRDDHRQRGHDQRAADGDDGQRARQRRRRRHVHEAQHVVVVAPDHPDRHAAHQQGLGQRLDQLDHRLRGKHALEAGERAELEQIGCSGLPEITIPPSTTLDSTAITASRPKIGNRVISAWPKPCTACSIITPGSSGTRWSKARPLRSTRSGPGTASRRPARSPRRRRPAS